MSGRAVTRKAAGSRQRLLRRLGPVMTVGILFLTGCSSGGGSGSTNTDTTAQTTETTSQATDTAIPSSDTTVDVGPHSGRQQAP
jgi:PBP1b-binding outer membrane lipoprotein LpoB